MPWFLELFSHFWKKIQHDFFEEEKESIWYLKITLHWFSKESLLQKKKNWKPQMKRLMLSWSTFRNKYFTIFFRTVILQNTSEMYLNDCRQTYLLIWLIFTVSSRTLSWSTFNKATFYIDDCREHCVTYYKTLHICKKARKEGEHIHEVQNSKFLGI